MEVKKVAIIGFGARGKIYKSFIDAFPDMFQIVAAVETDPQKREVLEKSNVPYVYEDYLDFLAASHELDLVIISTSDALHKVHAVSCLQKGYNLLLEKPIAVTQEDCREILRAANENNRRVYVCHVLRYTPFYRTIKEIIDSGELGEIINIHASENIGFFHYANSYVRGNWRNKEESSPIILAKCCHDMDILRYLIGEKCLAVSSVGSLNYFNKENAPEESTAYCCDCPVKNKCVYNAARLYTTYGSGFKGYFVNNDADKSEVINALKNSQYGKCVFHSDNNVADHQSTIMLFETGKTAAHTLSAFSKEIYRDIKIYGTKAELVGIMEKHYISIRPFGKKNKRIPVLLPEKQIGGHCGGDYYMMQQIYLSLNNQPCKGITYLDVSIESHEMAFAAEKSRETNGRLIELN